MSWFDDVTDAGSWAINPGGGITNALTGGLISGAIDKGENAIGNGFNYLTTTPGQKLANDDRQMLMNQMGSGSPYISNSPQTGNWSNLIKQLQLQSSGQGPSLAGDAYNNASNNAMNQAIAMSHGSTAGSARAGINQLGNVQSGMANGLANARNQEIMGARSQLGGAITGAEQTDIQRQKANQDAWLQLLNQQMGLTKAQMGLPTPMQQIGPIIQGAGNIAKTVAGGGVGTAGPQMKAF